MTSAKTMSRDAAHRIKRCLFVLCFICFFFGLSLVGLGCALCWQLEQWTGEKIPKLWTVGILPSVYAVVGIAALFHCRRPTILCWLILAFVAVPCCMVYYTICGFFETKTFWVYIQIYGDCVMDASQCRCTWESSVPSSASLVEAKSNCDHIRLATTLYLVFLGVLIVSLVLMVFINGLAFIMTTCLQHCTPLNAQQSTSTSVATLGNGVRGSEARSLFLKTRSKSEAVREYLKIPSIENDISVATERTSTAS